VVGAIVVVGPIVVVGAIVVVFGADVVVGAIVVVFGTNVVVPVSGSSVLYCPSNTVVDEGDCEESVLVVDLGLVEVGGGVVFGVSKIEGKNITILATVMTIMVRITTITIRIFGIIIYFFIIRIILNFYLFFI